MNERSKRKINKGDLGSGVNPCKSSDELTKVAKGCSDTIIWCSNIHISESGLSALAKGNNLIRFVE